MLRWAAEGYDGESKAVIHICLRPENGVYLSWRGASMEADTKPCPVCGEVIKE